MQVSGTTTSTTGALTSLSGLSGTSLGKEEFLQLLLAQLSHQDPLEPQSNEAFVAQLAQLGSLEEMQNVRSTLEFSAQLMSSVNNAVATSFIGRQAVVATEALAWSGEGPVQLGVNLAAAGEAALTIRNQAGAVVANVDLGQVEAGLTYISWDGKEGVVPGAAASSGALPPGRYTLTVAAKSGAGDALTGEAIIVGRVEGITFASGITQLQMEGITVPLASVREIDA